MKFRSVQTIGSVLGFILLLGWAGVLLQLINAPAKRSWIAEVFDTTKEFTTFFSAFNCFGCLLWLYGVSKTEFENKNVFMWVSAIWLSLNFGFSILFGVNLIYYFEAYRELQGYSFVLASAICATLIYVFLFVISYSIFKSLGENYQPSNLYTPDVLYPFQPAIYNPQTRNPYQPNMYVNKKSKSNQKKKQQNKYDKRYTDDYSNHMVDDDSDRLRNNFLLRSNEWTNVFTDDYNSRVSDDDNSNYASHDALMTACDTNNGSAACDTNIGDTGGCDSGGGGGGDTSGGDCGGGDSGGGDAGGGSCD